MDSDIDRGRVRMDIERSENNGYRHEITRVETDGKEQTATMEANEVLPTYLFAFLRGESSNSPSTALLSSLSGRPGRTSIEVDLDRLIVKVYAQGRWTWMACFPVCNSNSHNFPPVLFEGEDKLNEAFALLYFYRLFGYQQRGTQGMARPSLGAVSTGLMTLFQIARIGNYDPPRYPLSFISFLDKYVLPCILKAVEVELEPRPPKQDPLYRVLKSVINLIKECREHLSNNPTLATRMEEKVEDPAPSLEGMEELASPKVNSPTASSAFFSSPPSPRTTTPPGYELSTLNTFLKLKTASMPPSQQPTLLSSVEQKMLYDRNMKYFLSLHTIYSDLLVPELVRHIDRVFMVDNRGIYYLSRLIDLFLICAQGNTMRIIYEYKNRYMHKVPNTLTFSAGAVYCGIPLGIKPADIQWIKGGKVESYQFTCSASARIWVRENRVYLCDYYSVSGGLFANQIICFRGFNAKLIRLDYQPVPYSPVEYQVQGGVHEGITFYYSSTHIIALLCTKGYMNRMTTSHKIKILLFDLSTIENNQFTANTVITEQTDDGYSENIEGQTVVYILSACEMTVSDGWLLISSMYSVKGGEGRVPKYIYARAIRIDGERIENRMDIAKYRSAGREVFMRWIHCKHKCASFCLVQYSPQSIHMVAVKEGKISLIPTSWSSSLLPLPLEGLQGVEDMDINRHAVGMVGNNDIGDVVIVKIRYN